MASHARLLLATRRRRSRCRWGYGRRRALLAREQRTAAAPGAKSRREPPRDAMRPSLAARNRGRSRPCCDHAVKRRARASRRDRNDHRSHRVPIGEPTLSMQTFAQEFRLYTNHQDGSCRTMTGMGACQLAGSRHGWRAEAMMPDAAKTDLGPFRPNPWRRNRGDQRRSHRRVCAGRPCRYFPLLSTPPARRRRGRSTTRPLRDAYQQRRTRR